jgi:hypothetical protein
MNILSIIGGVVLSIIYILVFIYLFGYYCHEKDKKFGNSLITKFVVVIK